jgi:hypothetical protein
MATEANETNVKVYLEINRKANFDSKAVVNREANSLPSTSAFDNQERFHQSVAP